MTYSEAVRWGEWFKLMGEPKRLMVIDYLDDNDNFYTPAQIAEALNLTERDVARFCEELEDEYIVVRDFRDGEAYYKFASGLAADKISHVLTRIGE